MRLHDWWMLEYTLVDKLGHEENNHVTPSVTGFLDLSFDGYSVGLLVPVGILLIVEAISKFSSSQWSLTNFL
jgi:hypothetical protein